MIKGLAQGHNTVPPMSLELATLEPKFNTLPWSHCSPLQVHRKHVNSGHYRPSSETPSEWRFAGGPIVARDWMLAGSQKPKAEFLLTRLKVFALKDFSCYKY